MILLNLNPWAGEYSWVVQHLDLGLIHNFPPPKIIILSTYFLNILCKEMGSGHKMLQLHSTVQWLSSGKELCAVFLLNIIFTWKNKYKLWLSTSVYLAAIFLGSTVIWPQGFMLAKYAFLHTGLSHTSSPSYFLGKFVSFRKATGNTCQL
jgi:hypothetical protein